MCGIVGVSSSQNDAAQLAYGALVSVQHRGEESWGVAVAGKDGVECEHALGLIPGKFVDADKSTAAIGHTRYSTTGESVLLNCQPLVGVLDGGTAVAHNGQIGNAAQIRAENADYPFHTMTDSETILALLDGRPPRPDILTTAMGSLTGSYSVVALVEETLVAFRDPHGFRPLVMGHDGGMTVVASETCVLDVLGCRDQREVRPGELVVVDAGEQVTSTVVTAPRRQTFCVFEYLYLARGDSRFGGRRVGDVRARLGARLGQEAPAPADMVVPVPASGVPAARGYAEATGVPLVEALVRNEYVGRTFIEPDSRRRAAGLNVKFNLGEPVAGQRVVLVDDSIVRGNTMRRLTRRLWDAGAREVHVRIAAPPLIGPCGYGVDIASEHELVAAGRTPAEVAAMVGATSVEYLSMAGMEAAVGHERLCRSCLTGRKEQA